MILAEVGKGRVPGKDGGAREGPEGMGWLARMEGTSLDGDPNCHGRMASLGGDQKGQVGDKQGDWRGLRADSERHQEAKEKLGREGAWQVLGRVEGPGGGRGRGAQQGTRGAGVSIKGWGRWGERQAAKGIGRDGAPQGAGTPPNSLEDEEEDGGGEDEQQREGEDAAVAG